MNPRDFLDVASDWATGSREAEWRSAASRAYFAVFHVAQQLLQRCGFVVPNGDQAHAYLWLRLANSGRPDIQRVGNDLNALRRRRNQADYDLDQFFDSIVAVDCVQSAIGMIRDLEDLQTTPAILAQVVSAIQVYERDVLKQVTWQP